MKYTLRAPRPAETAGEARYVEVALNVPRLETLTYRAPLALAERLAPGLRVWVPLGGRKVTGYVVSPPAGRLPAGLDPTSLKDVIEPLEEEPLIGPELLDLTRWIAGYYCCGWGEALRAALPGVPERKELSRFRLTGQGRREAALEAAGLGLPGMEAGGSLRARILAGLRKGPRGGDSLASSFGRGARAELDRLVRAGLAEWVVEEKGGAAPVKIRVARLAAVPPPGELEKLRKRAPRQAAALEALSAAPGGRMPLRDLEAASPGARAACAALAKRGRVALEEEEAPAGAPPPGEGEETRLPPPPALNPAQQDAFDAAAADLREGRFSVTLLHGVTGSGKTEVFLRLAGEAARAGKGSLILVPEIGLTPQFLGRVRARFGERIACMHSGYSEKRRDQEWHRIWKGEAAVVVGTRSAVFAPVRSLGFIAVDEEHDPSYKQEESPRYHARDTAVVRAQRLGIPAVLGSATPSVESYFNARQGRYRLKELPVRPGGRPLPEVRVVDLRREQGKDARSPLLLSADLARAVRERLSKGEQALLFLNRRGFSSVLLCRDCGAAVECANCSAPLTFHRERGGRLRCHLCDADARPPGRCPACGSERVGYFGLGTERVEEAVRVRFPGARLVRMDRDTVRRAGDYDRVLASVRRGEADVLIGTQMVAKGHDFPKLTLVGVVLADVGLHLPDFRASERTFQLLTQVAGRAGRAELAGEAVIQTFRPDHYAVACARTHDYAAFYAQEIAARERAGYPPFRRLTRLRFEAKQEDVAARAGEWSRRFLERQGAQPAGKGGAVEYLGPAPAPLERVRGVWRRHMLLKSRTSQPLGEAVRALMGAFNQEKALRAAQLIVDVDPQNLL
ncbi:MAG: primosomal protein N' [Candidatus Tectomicrobia bacterium]|nr:primosomal protein N' [Candidatus Tectomicrobia bacterium]